MGVGQEPEEEVITWLLWWCFCGDEKLWKWETVLMTKWLIDDGIDIGWAMGVGQEPEEEVIILEMMIDGGWWHDYCGGFVVVNVDGADDKMTDW